MGKYNGAVITTAGQNLIAQAIAESKTVTFTTAQASSHVYPSSTDFEALTALTDVEKTVDINYAGVYSDTVVQVSARFDNGGVETAYLINTLGFFAQLGSDAPILFAVSTAVTPDQMPVFDADNPSAFIYNMQITVQNASSINVTVNPAGTVTVEQLNTVINTINANIGDLSDLTTDDKTSLVNSINEVDSHADAAQSSADIVQAQVSNSGDAYDPTRPYKVGELRIHNDVLYRCTTPCSAGSWTTNQSCFTADTLVNVVSGTQHIEKGLVIGGAGGEKSVSFDRPFTTTPTVVATPINTTTPTDFIRSVVITEITTTGFKFYEMAMNANGLIVGIDDIRWIAVGDN